MKKELNKKQTKKNLSVTLCEVGKKMLSLKFYAQHYLHIHCMYYDVYSSFISCKL